MTAAGAATAGTAATGAAATAGAAVSVLSPVKYGPKLYDKTIGTQSSFASY